MNFSPLLFAIATAPPSPPRSFVVCAVCNFTWMLASLSFSLFSSLLLYRWHKVLKHVYPRCAPQNGYEHTKEQSEKNMPHKSERERETWNREREKRTEEKLLYKFTSALLNGNSHSFRREFFSLVVRSFLEICSLCIRWDVVCCCWWLLLVFRQFFSPLFLIFCSTLVRLCLRTPFSIMVTIAAIVMTSPFAQITHSLHPIH